MSKTKKETREASRFSPQKNGVLCFAEATQQDQDTGFRHFVDDAPLLWHPSANEPFAKDVDVFFQQYRDSLKYDRQVLLIVINVQM